MIIKPYHHKVLINVQAPTAGELDLSAKPTVVEYGEVVAVGNLVSDLKVGDKLFFKAWALDVITHEGETYYFLDTQGEGICAVTT